jgi:hypothetical protein
MTEPTKKTTDDYEVGYRKPPKATQFQKGKSGNPSGGKKEETPNLIQCLADLSMQGVRVKRGETVRFIGKDEAFIRAVVNKAMEGNPRVFRTFLTLARKAKLIRPVEIDYGPAPPGSEWIR